ncbi:class I SAM-dependent methyltransferase [Wenxinia saemankumensis]|uniref:Methyltransferase domain-containing protein n=1 Tax=Wenxinia saemankumensis TaxID=1447782 RepID=A0A1M6ADH6_9RHOB|nr:class I SAM-dependent methyltransferase [Wenxinia saemankumensis]SHI34515.1 Methyltransferase domain-containing protein [Wenxinia saemankumensis]
MSGQSARTDWTAYATSYDLLSDHNPAYRALMEDFERFVGSIERPEVVYDIGGGTGNYTRIAARAFPDSRVRLVEPDSGMIARAKEKMSDLPNVGYDQRPLEQVAATEEADLVVCVHALYTMPDQEERLRDLARLLRAGGILYLVDIGRYLDLKDWRGYLFRQVAAKEGLLGALRIFWRGREITRANTEIGRSQQAGTYWTYEAGALARKAREAGLEVLRQDIVYRGYSDLVVCRKS